MVETQTTEKKCKFENCKRPYRAKSMCNSHYKKWRRGETDKKPRYKICSEENCKGAIHKAGYCQKHYDAWVVSRKGEDKGPEAAAPAAPAAEAPATQVEAAPAPALAEAQPEEKKE